MKTYLIKSILAVSILLWIGCNKDSDTVPESTISPGVTICNGVKFSNGDVSNSNNQMVLSGTISGLNRDEFPITEHGHFFAKDRIPNENDYDKKTELGTRNSQGEFKSTIQNIAYSSTYYYRAYVESNGEICIHPDAVKVETEALSIADVETLSVTELSPGTFNIKGKISNIGNAAINRFGFEYSSSSGSTEIEVGGNLQGVFSHEFNTTIADISANDIYEIRAFAENDSGTRYGAKLLIYGKDAWKNYNLYSAILTKTFEEDFSNNNNNWYEASSSETDSGTIYNVTSGAYLIRTPDDFTPNIRIDALKASSENYQVELEVRQSYTPEGASGIRFEGDDNSFGYLFGVKNDGDEYYTIGYWDENDSYNSLSYSTSFPLNSGYNKLTVRKVNGIFYFFINEEFIFEQDDFLYTGKHFRLRSSKGGWSYFDNITIRRIGD